MFMITFNRRLARSLSKHDHNFHREHGPSRLALNTATRVMLQW